MEHWEKTAREMFECLMKGAGIGGLNQQDLLLSKLAEIAVALLAQVQIELAVLHAPDERRN